MSVNMTLRVNLECEILSTTHTLLDYTFNRSHLPPLQKKKTGLFKLYCIMIPRNLINSIVEVKFKLSPL